MVALDIVHASNAQLRELGPGLVALFGELPQVRLLEANANQLQLVAQVELGNSPLRHSSRIQSLRESTWWDEMLQPQTESLKNAGN